MQEVLRGVVRRFVVRRGANQPKTIVDAHSTAARRQMACGKRPISLRPKAVGAAIRTRCSTGFFFSGALRHVTHGHEPCARIDSIPR